LSDNVREGITFNKHVFGGGCDFDDVFDSKHALKSDKMFQFSDLKVKVN
jgi:hypothetical protein